MKKVLLFLAGFILIIKSAGYGQDTTKTRYNLQQCIETAIANNPSVIQTAFQTDFSKVGLQQARGTALPFINGNIIHGINQGRSIDPYTNSYIDQQNTFGNYSLNASINLWNGFSTQNNIQSNKLNYEASQMDLQQSKDNLTINVILAYLQILSTEEQLANLKEQQVVTSRQVERLKLLNDEGAITPSTLYDLRGQLANDELNAVNEKNLLESAKLNLAQLMNIDYSDSMHVAKLSVSNTPVLYDATSDQIFQLALQNLSVIKAADLRKQSAEFAVKSAKGATLPMLSLGAGIFTNYSSTASISQLVGTSDVASDNYVLFNSNKLPVYAPQSTYENQKISYGSQWKNNFNSSINLALQIPILNGLQAKSRIRQAKITEREDDFNAKTSRILLKQNIQQAYLNMQAAFLRLQTLDTQVKDFEESFRAAEIKFNAGVGSSVDYLIAKNNYTTTNTNLISAKYDYLLRTKILDYYQGKSLW